MTFEDLICKQECADLLFHHARLLDLNENAAAYESFTADATLAGPTGDEVRVTAMRERMLGQDSTRWTPRILTNLVVTPTGPDTATAFGYVTMPMPDVPKAEWRYELRKTDKGWRISRFQVIPVVKDQEEMDRIASQMMSAQARQKPTP